MIIDVNKYEKKYIINIFEPGLYTIKINLTKHSKQD